MKFLILFFLPWLSSQLFNPSPPAKDTALQPGWTPKRSLWEPGKVPFFSEETSCHATVALDRPLKTHFVSICLVHWIKSSSLDISRWCHFMAQMISEPSKYGAMIHYLFHRRLTLMLSTLLDDRLVPLRKRAWSYASTFWQSECVSKHPYVTGWWFLNSSEIRSYSQIGSCHQEKTCQR